MEHARVGDKAIVALLVAGTALYVLPFLNPSWQVYEDALMLFRYAEHVSSGNGIVWNIGDPPVDGATDLLFMWIIAGLHWAGAGIDIAARVVSTVSHLATVVLVYVGVRRLASGGQLAAFLSALFVAAGPGKAYIAAGFGTPLFALCVGLAWVSTLTLIRKPTVARAVVCGCAGVLMGVSRPEGALLAILIVVSLLVYWRDSPFRRLIWPIVITGAVLGGAYWVWRWTYFGYPLPNPYYRKGGGRIYFYNFLVTAKYGTLHIAPFLVPLAIGLIDRRVRRVTMLAAIPVAGFLAAWVLLSNEMNFFRRFQYPIVPIVAMSWPMWISDRVREWWRSLTAGLLLQRAAIAAVAVVLIAVTLRYEHLQYFPPRWQDDLYRVGVNLAPYRDRGYTLAISEAGQVPFYSKWKTIDVWGLNDQWVAHHGVVSAAYLDQFAPEVVIFHARCVPLNPNDPDPSEAMVRAMADYTRTRPYVLSTRTDNGAGWSVIYFVRRNFKDSAEIDRVLRTSTSAPFQHPTPLADCPQ